MNQARARRFSPIFSATVIPSKVEPLVSATGEDYTRMSATLRREGKPDIQRVVMAFGQSNLNVRHLLKPGQPVELAIQMNGGSAKVIGLPKITAVIGAATAVDAAPDEATAALENVVAEIAAVLHLFDIDSTLQASIIEEMITGESEGPAEDVEEDVSEIAALVHEQEGHILFPLLNSGLDYRTACRAVDLIRDLPAAGYLDDARTFREQTSVHALLAA